MKLVEILAKKLDVWPTGAAIAVQDGDALKTVKFGSKHANPSIALMGVKDVWQARDWKYTYQSDFDHSVLASDWKTAIVTKKQWQAERDRQKGGEWKRHRGGKCPVPDQTQVEVKFRDGDIRQSHASDFFGWKHGEIDDARAEVMQYRVISQPQAAEVEAKRNAAKDVDVEYAFGAPDADMSNLDWKPMGKCKVSNIEFDSAETEEERAKDTTVGTLTYKVDINTGPAMQALNELSAKLDQVESPFKWRDTVNELDAYIEEFTRERESLINRLAEEGFALLPAMTAVMGVADKFTLMNGDIVRCVETNLSCAYLTIGREYTICTRDGDLGVIDDEGDHMLGCKDSGELEFVRRP